MRLTPETMLAGHRIIQTSNGGILTRGYRLSYHLFSNMHKRRINTGDFYGLA